MFITVPKSVSKVSLNVWFYPDRRSKTPVYDHKTLKTQQVVTLEKLEPP